MSETKNLRTQMNNWITNHGCKVGILLAIAVGIILIFGLGDLAMSNPTDHEYNGWIFGGCGAAIVLVLCLIGILSE